MIYSFPYTKNTLPLTATNTEYLFWFQHWQTIRDCLMGEILVKARREQYLPRLHKQADDEYNAYLARATFYNATARTVAGLVGAVHARPPVIEGLPSSIDLSSVTSDGQSMDMFMKKITREIVSVGRYGVMIDAPPDGGEPYFVGYECEDIVDWSSTRIGSREKLDYVVLREIRATRLPFQQNVTPTQETFRVLFLDDDGFYKQRVYEGSVGNSLYAQFVPLLQGQPMTEIPFLMISPTDFSFEVEKPPILDIALMNISHYRSYAELESGRFRTAMPVFTIAMAGGGDEDAEFVVGPNVIWQMGQNDKADLLEFSGAGLKFLESALVTKEQQMSALGGKLSTQPSGTAAESSDAVLSRVRSEASFLGSVISTVSETASRLLSSLSAWRGTPARVTVELSSEATQIYLDGREIRAVAMLYDTGLMPMQTIFNVFRQNNIIPRGMEFSEFERMLPEFAPKVKNKVDEASQKADILLDTQAELTPMVTGDAKLQAETDLKIAKMKPAPVAPKPAPKPAAAKPKAA